MRPEEVYRIQPENVNLTGGYLFNPHGKTKAARRRVPLTTACPWNPAQAYGWTEDFLPPPVRDGLRPTRAQGKQYSHPTQPHQTQAVERLERFVAARQMESVLPEQGGPAGMDSVRNDGARCNFRYSSVSVSDRGMPKLLRNWRRGSESNRRIKVLQTSPLPLGYRAPQH
jgi:hypothetical protein